MKTWLRRFCYPEMVLYTRGNGNRVARLRYVGAMVMILKGW